MNPHRLSEETDISQTELLIKAGYKHVEGAPKPQPISRPQFTLTELKNAIPSHCFERSMVKSFGFLILDIAIITSLIFCAYALFELQFLSAYFQLLYPVYWFVQGSFLFGIWVLAHECGELILY